MHELSFVLSPIIYLYVSTDGGIPIQALLQLVFVNIIPKFRSDTVILIMQYICQFQVFIHMRTPFDVLNRLTVL